MKLSIAMIVKNEEKNIERTLKPLKELEKHIEAEIIVVDTGSSDRTVDIAKKYTNKIYYHNWNNNFGSMRNISIDYCKGEWVLIVDADEVLIDIESFVEILNGSLLNNCNGGFIKIVNFDSDIEATLKYGAISPMLRLFRRNTVKYVGAIHEQPQFEEPVMDTDVRFIHYGYDNNDANLMEYKFKRNETLLLEELKKDSQNVYLNFQIATTYLMHSDILEALKYIEYAYNFAKDNIQQYIYVLDKYCLILFKYGDHEQLFEKAKEGVRYYSNSIDFNFYLGLSCITLMKYNEAIPPLDTYLKYCTDAKNNFNSTLSVQTLKFKSKVVHNLALSYYKSKDYFKALDILVDNYENVEDKSILLILKVIIEGRLYNKINKIDRFIDKYNYGIFLNYINSEVGLEDLKKLYSYVKNGILKNTIKVIIYFRENSNIEDTHYNIIRDIFETNNSLYASLLYYILKRDVNSIYELSIFGKGNIESMLISITTIYYDINEIILSWIEVVEIHKLDDLVIKTVFEKALLLGGNLRRDKRKEIFLDYVYNKYIFISKLYTNEIRNNKKWILAAEDRFIIDVKEALYNKYNNSLEYIKLLKNTLQLEKSYSEYIKLLTSDIVENNINKEIKELIPSLKINIEQLINNENYNEAYNTLEEALKMVKFDFDLMLLKYNLLVAFDYKNDAEKILKEIILYGDNEKVLDIINSIQV